MENYFVWNLSDSLEQGLLAKQFHKLHEKSSFWNVRALEKQTGKSHKFSNIFGNLVFGFLVCLEIEWPNFDSSKLQLDQWWWGECGSCQIFANSSCSREIETKTRNWDPLRSESPKHSQTYWRLWSIRSLHSSLWILEAQKQSKNILSKFGWKLFNTYRGKIETRW